jgi:phytoene dehydrogenase-like protein
VVGAGLAGLACAQWLHRAGVPVVVYEASDGVGGRARTDNHEGFLLDRGFHVLQTAYPEVQRLLQFTPLHLQCFDSGALLARNGHLYPLLDPWQHPLAAWHSVSNPVGTLWDRLRVALLRSTTAQRALYSGLWADTDNPSQPLTCPEREAIWPEDVPPPSTLEALQRLHFSDDFILHFFRPFFGGVFLDASLSVPSPFFDFLFAVFSQGRVALPAHGIGALAQQLATGVPVHLCQPIRHILPSGIEPAAGPPVAARAVVLATPHAATCQLLQSSGLPLPASISETRPGRPVWCGYLALKKPPTRKRLLVLNAEGIPPLLHCAVLTNVQPGYSPDPHRALLSATVVAPHVPETPAQEVSLQEAVKQQLMRWFPSAQDEIKESPWLKTYVIETGLPSRWGPQLGFSPLVPRTLAGNIWLCGDYTQSPSVQGALRSGRQVAEAILTADMS